MKHIFRLIGNKLDEHVWILEDDEAFHVKKVLRLKSGDYVEVTDGRGIWISGAIKELTEKRASITVEKVFSTPKRDRILIVAIGALKPKTMDEILPVIVELGADQIMVFGQHSGETKRLDNYNMERWQRLIKESIKQCKRAWIPDILLFKNIDAFLASTSPIKTSNRFYCDENASDYLSQCTVCDDDVLLVIGNEGGLSDSDVTALGKNGFAAVKLADTILKASTAVVAALSVTNGLMVKSNKT